MSSNVFAILALLVYPALATRPIRNEDNSLVEDKVLAAEANVAEKSNATGKEDDLCKDLNNVWVHADFRLGASCSASVVPGQFSTTYELKVRFGPPNFAQDTASWMLKGDSTILGISGNNFKIHLGRNMGGAGKLKAGSCLPQTYSDSVSLVGSLTSRSISALSLEGRRGRVQVDYREGGKPDGEVTVTAEQVEAGEMKSGYLKANRVETPLPDLVENCKMDAR